MNLTVVGLILSLFGSLLLLSQQGPSGIRRMHLFGSSLLALGFAIQICAFILPAEDADHSVSQYISCKFEDGARSQPREFLLLKSGQIQDLWGTTWQTKSNTAGQIVAEYDPPGTAHFRPDGYVLVLNRITGAAEFDTVGAELTKDTRALISGLSGHCYSTQYRAIR